MVLKVQKSTLDGCVAIPGSKSHTVRAVAIASLAKGESIIQNPLEASDTHSSLSVFSALGAKVEAGEVWKITGTGGHPVAAPEPIDVGNSGTTLYIAAACAALCDGENTFTGDSQICRRPAGPLIDAINALGARAESLNNNLCAPFRIKGPLKGGKIELDSSKTSQYLTSLLLACPLSDYDTEITPLDLVEVPYIEMTLGWLQSQNIKLDRDGMKKFIIPGGQMYSGFESAVPGDFSSAAFFICGAVLRGENVVIEGLDPADTQGDKAIVSMLQEMGADIHWDGNRLLVKHSELKGRVLDLGNTPDALPALAVTACFADGETRIVNVAQARMKETDRISVMASELSKMGADVQELPDGMVINGTSLHSALVRGHGDHRVIMALAIAGMACTGVTEISEAESVEVTFPTFPKLIQNLGAVIQID